ncbi:2OG-Fe(II) oxygenase [Bradymonadaceae bacterium TMQ3]|uniref:2OG-Fe(II) oxygenase n=1 Tax=Lujinxingia sediminis TaxID=2480984 RepID=A0ABY0CXI1_9DELT|nr:2OG-Fe(II) oxygenase [Lujinxingia sediminis]RDV39366.1 2OG-Fe(II) oxygenase [Bradymonadaceae bacterium TMQ3]RVU48597.1 2OG-Fe(II) oxygenase [Lujinxingia sediminis]TXC77891.1 2OG-Fe(II) oxygenase [Bradymonadales bacterium TMQ1]
MRQPSPPVQHPVQPDLSDSIADALIEKGYACVPGFLSPPRVQALAAETLRLWDDGEFQFARIGSGPNRQRCPQVRSDRILWLDNDQLSAPQQIYLDALDTLRQHINRATMMGLVDWEGHLALYPPGTFYKRHIDVFANARERQLTTILYLNPNWRPGDGGELRLYLDGAEMEPYIDLEPRGGTLVTFLSSRFYHEVLPAHTERLSITGWYRVRSTRHF